MKLENKEKVRDLLSIANRIKLELFHIEKLKKASMLEIRTRDGYASVVVELADVASILDNLESKTKARLAQIDAQLEEM